MHPPSPMLRKLICTLLLATPAFATTIGELQPGGGTVASRGGTLAPLTVISFSRPALEGGTVDRATVIWAGAPGAGCDDAFRIKFFRPGPTGLQVTAERGPFDAELGINTVQLAPAVAIQPGDLIGITQLQPVACGGVVNRRSDRSEAWGTVSSDPPAGSTVSNIEFTHGLVPSLRATNENNPIYGYLPVVGSTPGNFNSFFRTGVQMTNRGNSTISGRLVFHPAGRSAQVTDPFVTYTLQPDQTISIDDVVAAAGVSGIGSMDVVPTTGYPPDITARIYNDAGTAGTAGFTETVMTPHQALQRFDRGSLQVPADLTNFRMNIGVRTLDDGVTLNIIHYDANGTPSAAVQRVYPANYFEQVSASQFLDNTALAAGGHIVIRVDSGSAFVYSAVTDNRTNDGSIRFPTKY